MKPFSNIDVVYNSPYIDTYEQVNLRYIIDNQEVIRYFKTDEFYIDWFLAKKFFMKELYAKDHVHYKLNELSSIDLFMVDGADEKYDTCFLNFDENDQPYLDYEGYNGWRFFTPKGERYSWVELAAKVDEFLIALQTKK